MGGVWLAENETDTGFVDSAKAASESAIGVVSGVAGGFMLMALPLITIGVVIALTTWMIRAPGVAVNRRLV